ncbi:hypothetical protein N7466_006161 [Penicillium verhagenii]|uniref:uncharacterized protein n=1 Tax=Penicillium verhagenii TaxID=1562060 RepID=UPI002545161D|nr:uncharacterized protein N7466_006161 [Penicillium verhagenii]KAJ5930668.1 hypothetical protein N7466_006161 [Penicillium verhagenii]
MTVQEMAPVLENKYPRRGDRLQEEPSAKNAQGLFPPDACIFVGNLSTKVAAEAMTEDLKNAFTVYGPCHVKIKQDKKKGLPGAFVQFEQVEHANAALNPDERITLHDRWLRIERAKGRRTACLGLRSGAPITQQDISSALSDRGHLEFYCIESFPTGPHTWTWICKVTFAYVDDCRDAIKYFQKDSKYYLSLLDMDGSPLAPNVGRPLPLRPRANSSSQPWRNNNHSNQNGQNGRNGHPRYNKPYRNGNGPSRGGYRGPPRYPNQQALQENIHPPHFNGEFPVPQFRGDMPPPHLRGGCPNPPYWGHGMPYNNDPHPSFYPPPPHHPMNGFGNPPFIMNGPPRYDHPNLLPPPEMYNPGMPNGPLIVNGQPPYGGPNPAFYPEFFTPESAFMSPPSSVSSQPGGYFPPQPYTEPYMPGPHPDYLVPPSAPIKITPPPTEKTQVVEEKATDNGGDDEVTETGSIEKLLERMTVEQAPKLIRVYDSDTESDGEADEDKVPVPIPASTVEHDSRKHTVTILDPVKEEDEESAVEKAHDTQSSEQTAVSGPSSEDQASTPSHSCSRSRSCSPPSRVPFEVPSKSSPKAACQNIHAVGGKTIAEYVRSMVEARQQDNIDETFDESLVREVILSLELEMQQEKELEIAEEIAEADKKKEQGKERSVINRGSSSSRSCSLTRTCSVKSI